MDPSNKGAFGNAPTQQSLPKTTQSPPTAPWNSPVTQAPPPPQWPVPGSQNAPMPTAGQQTNPTEPWAPTNNQQPQSWTSAPQFAAQPTTQPPPVTSTSRY